ncbi:MAG: hypothetical protein KA436_02050 [Oligoflexales bacterium]|nr:hypothetical protein [Oligoflexales bacterium]
MREIRVWIHGLYGRMGNAIQSSLEKAAGLPSSTPPLVFVGGSDRGTDSGVLFEGLKNADLILDFSSKEGNAALVDLIRSRQLRSKSWLIGTTALSEDSLSFWKNESLSYQFKTLMAPNTSVGIILMLKTLLFLTPRCAEGGFDVEMIETHRKGKMDAPSGTGLLLASAVHPYKPEAPIHSLRGGGVFGEHSVRFLAEHEEICITHRAFSRELFARGACVLGGWLLAKKEGFYTLQDL